MSGREQPRRVVLQDGTFLFQSAGREVSSDTYLLGLAVSAPPGSTVFDLGSGSGGAALIAARANPGCVWVGVDSQLTELRLAMRSARANGAGSYLGVCADVKTLPFLMPKGIADLVMANPPYLRSGKSRPSPDPARRASRSGEGLTTASFVRAAAHLLRAGGRFLVVNRPANLVELVLGCRSYGLSPTELRTFGAPKDPAELMLLTARKGSSRELRIMPREKVPAWGDR
jgi:tRNA1(Val) A37 N6-methylase TrmN6